MSIQKAPTHHIDPHADPHMDTDADSEEEFDLLAVMEKMTLEERRKVYALNGLWNDYKAIRGELREKLAKLQLENLKACKPLFALRRAIVAGEQDVVPSAAEDAAGEKQEEEHSPEAEATAAPLSSSARAEETKKSVKVVSPIEELAHAALEKAAADKQGGIPNFWLTAMSNSEVLDDTITERDRLALAHLTDVTIEYVEEDPQKGVSLVFFFSPNEYFTNTTLRKTYHMEFNEESNDMEITTIEGCDIEWTSPKNKLTVVVKEKKQRNTKNNKIRVVEREEKCDSFFNFFSPPKEEEDKDNADEEDNEDDHEKMEIDIEAGQALMEDIVPRAAHYFIGKPVDEVAEMLHDRLKFGADSGSDQLQTDEEREDAENNNSGESAPKQKQECKQQ